MVEGLSGTLYANGCISPLAQLQVITLAFALNLNLNQCTVKVSSNLQREAQFRFDRDMRLASREADSILTTVESVAARISGRVNHLSERLAKARNAQNGRADLDSDINSDCREKSSADEDLNTVYKILQ